MILRSTTFIRIFCFKRFISSNLVSSTVLSRPGKKFVEHENEFAHSILANLPQYGKSIILESVKETIVPETDLHICDENLSNWDGLSVDQMCDKFKHVSSNARKRLLPLENQCFNIMCVNISNRCPEISDDHLLILLKYLNLWPLVVTPKEKNFFTLWKALDSACISRWKSWDIDKTLLFTDSWYNLRLTRQSDFVYTSNTKIAMNPSRLLPHQVVQLLFYLNVMRTISKSISMYNLEHRLGEIVRHLTIEEIGVAVMGFFKTQNVIHGEKLKNYIIDRMIKEIDAAPDITIASLLKALRGSMSIPLWDRIPELMDALETQVDRLSLKCSIHINLLSVKCLTLHEGTLEKVSKKLISCIKNSRLKDLEKIMFPLTYLNYNSPTTLHILDYIVKEFNDPNRMSEFDEYPKSLIALVYYLTLKKIFVEKAVFKVLDMDFIRRTYGRTNFRISREILGIDTYAEVMQPLYTGPRLPEEVRNYLSKRYSTFLPDPNRKLSKHSQFLSEVFETAEKLLGKECVTYKNLVPHHSRADIVFNLRCDREPLVIPDSYRNIEDFTGPLRAPDGGIWCALVIASRNMFLHRLPVVTGETSSKLDLVKTLGYKPILVSCWDWPSNKEDRVAYLRKLIQF